MDEKKCVELETIAATCSLEALQTKPLFQKAFLMARGINDLPSMIGKAEMAEIMPLMNSALGFLTDRNPANKDKETGKPITPYSEEVVKEVFIEATLRGFFTIGNEFNIIGGRFYGAKAGLMRKAKSFPGLSNLKTYFGIPVLSGDKGAKILCKASWILNGTADSLEREFAIRVNYGMGADAITGKAERKLYAAILNQLTGIHTPDGDAGDSEAINVTPERPEVETVAEKLAKAKAAEPAKGEPQKTPEATKAVGLSPLQQKITELDGNLLLKAKKQTGIDTPLAGLTDQQCRELLTATDVIHAEEKAQESERGF